MRRVTQGPAEETAYPRAVVMHALQVVRGSVDRVERVQAAHVVHVVDMNVFPILLDEGAVTDVTEVISLRLADGPVVDFLLSFLRRRAPDLRKLARGLQRLGERAYRERLRAALASIVSVMLDVPEWRSCVLGDWARAALVFDSRFENRRSQGIIRRWLDAFGSVPEWMREEIEEHPGVILWHLDDDARWRLHRAAPTTIGSTRLARTPSQYEQMLAAQGFGEQLDHAIETLQAAITGEPDEATRVALARWLVEIGGS